MSDIDFQNGFLCGMATKGLSRSGNMYEPTIWNDSGVYTYFYIDFRRALEPFSLGMLTESLIISNGVNNLPITGYEMISSSIYKIYCNISNCADGVIVINKKTTRLSFASGDVLPVFSTMFYVSGQVSYIQLKYIYETTHWPVFSFSDTETETVDLCIILNVALDEFYDSDIFPAIGVMPVAENVLVELMQ